MQNGVATTSGAPAITASFIQSTILRAFCILSTFVIAPECIKEGRTSLKGNLEPSFFCYSLDMSPDAIIIFSAGVMPLGAGGWRTTTYDDKDAFGTLGGRDRVEAAVLLAKKYPNIYLVTTSHNLDRATPSLAQVYADELRALGVAPERIGQEERPSTTGSVVATALQLAQEKGWKHLLLLSNEYHLPRIAAFYKEAKSDIKVTIVSSESVLISHDPAFAERFAEVKKTSAYQARLAAEARGIAAIKGGTYRPAPIEDKKERPV